MLRLVTHRPDQQQPEFCFFILNKGNNSGKPLTQPCANCFMAVCLSKDEKEFYYWLCWGLWQAKRFEHFLLGSVIPYIRKKDVLDLVHKQAAIINNASYKATVHKVQLLAQHESIVNEQLKTLKQLKVALLRQHLKI